MLQTLVGHIVARSVSDKLLDSKVGAMGSNILGCATKAVVAGSEFMAGLKLWGQQKTVKRVKKPRGKNMSVKKVTGKRKETASE